MTSAELAKYIGLRVRFDFDEPNERYEHFDLLGGIDDEVAVWGESNGTQFIPLASILRVELEPDKMRQKVIADVVRVELDRDDSRRNVMPQLFAEAHATLTAAGFALGPEMRGALMVVRRSAGDTARCWIDIVNTVRIIGDHETDPDGELFDAVAAALK